MLKNLTESLKTSIDFEGLISKMKAKGFDIQRSSNIKDGISGMQIILEKDKNLNTERQYKAGYTLSQISNKLKISEIKLLFQIKQSIHRNQKNGATLNDLRNIMQLDGLKMRFQYKGEFKPNQKNEVQDIRINKVTHSKENLPKDGFFYQKLDGFSFLSFDNNFVEVSKMYSQNQPGRSYSKKPVDSILEIPEDLIEDILKPTYVAQQEDDWWKKKRKGR